MSTEKAMKVAVRARPTLPQETKDGCIDILHFFDDKPQMIAALDKPFEFDHVFRPESEQEDVYEAIAKPLLHKAIAGFNCTVIAHGSTGTGKSYTMGFTPESCGMTPKTLEYLFSDEVQENGHLDISVSFIEIYNGKIYNILGKSNKPMTATQARNRRGLPVYSAEEALQLLADGGKARRTRATALNPASSRSHAIFTIHLNSGDKGSCFHLVDLAGAEGVRRTGACGDAFVEGVRINRGLLAVGNLMRALATATHRQRLNYREDVLTNVLQDALNAGSYVTLMACVSGADAAASVTVESLRFASRARGARLRPEQWKVFQDYKKQNASLFDKMSSLIHKVPPTPSAKLWHPRHYMAVANTSPTLSDISELSDVSEVASIASYSTITESEPTYSPIMRKCMENLNSQLNEKVDSIMRTMLREQASGAPTLPQPSPSSALQALATPNNRPNIKDSEQWTILCTEMRSIVRDELKNLISQRGAGSGDSGSPKTSREGGPEEPYIAAADRLNAAKCRLNFYNDDQNEEPKVDGDTNIFKMPMPMAKPKTKRINTKRIESNKPATKRTSDLTLEKGNDENSSFITRRKSKRLSIRNEDAQSTAENDDNYSNYFSDQNLQPTPRRSLRLSTIGKESMSYPIQTPQRPLRDKTNLNSATRISSVRRKMEDEIVAMTPNSKSRKKEIISESLMSLHRQTVFQVLNRGSEKELMKLPTIGAKTAAQIYTYRMLNGTLQTEDDLKMLPCWKGSALDRFLMSNNLLKNDE